MDKPLVLVIEDERRFRELIEMNLTRYGYRVVLATDGLSGLTLVQRVSPDLVLLNLVLPDVDGFEVCHQIRESSSVPIIMLTARAEREYEIRGLEIGADDYVTKPFHLRELLARIAAVLRRSMSAEAAVVPLLASGDLEIDVLVQRVSLGGRVVDLTRLEFKLLYQLVRRSGRVVEHDELLQVVWGRRNGKAKRLLHTTIYRLRRKLEPNPSRPRYILTERGIGYSLAPGGKN